MSKRMISLLLVLCLVFSLLPVSALAVEEQGDDAAGKTSARNPFKDVTEDSWYYDDVLYVYDNGIFLGVSETSFAPANSMSRAMFVTVLGRLAGVETENYPDAGSFTDVSADAYYAPYVAWAAKYGIASGTGAGRFSPDAPVSRQEMAVFFVRYFEAFDVDYGAGEGNADSAPADIDKVAGWARDAVLKLWRAGLLNGDGVSFDPESHATRAQTAAICHRADNAVTEWRSETDGAVTEQVVEMPEITENDKYYVHFYDGTRRIASLGTEKGTPLGRLPSAEKSSKPGAILLGYYMDPEFTEPFYADEPLTHSFNVYARYQELDSGETLNFTTFTQLDQSPYLSFSIRRVSGTVSANNAAVLTVKDGSDPVSLSITGADGIYTVSAIGGFNEGCSYELTLADGWIFDGKPETIRTASFSIFKEEVDNMSMNPDIKYLADTEAISYTVGGRSHPVLTSELATESGSFTYGGTPSLSEGDVLCVYVGTHPDERNAKNGGELLDPAVYVKVSSVSGSRVSYEPLGEDDQLKLYDIPDNFPLLVTETNGSANISELDVSMYENMMGKDDGTLENAKTKIGVGDFVTLYAGAIHSEGDLCFGEITGYNEETGAITYTKTTKQAVIDSMDLYTKVDIEGGDLVSDEQQQMLVEAVQEQLDNSDFGEQAARMLVELASNTDEFQDDPAVSELLGPRGGDGTYSAEAVKRLAAGLSLDRGSIKVTARLVTSGRQLHFNGGVQLAIDVKAKFNAPIGNSLSNTLSIDLEGTFVEEVAVQPTIKGSLVTKEVLFIPVPIGVQVNANIDVRNYTALSFDAEISTHDNSSVLYSTHIASDLIDMMSASEKGHGLSDEYESSLKALMARYSELLYQETDWITLVEEDIFEGVEIGIKAVGIGIEGTFVVKTDMSIAIGSNLEYEVGKRYTFWFKVGLFTPTAGSSTMDLIDESFAFQFYVLGKLGVRAGVKLLLYVQLGGGKLAKAGVSADLGPYIKLYGFFIYEVSKYRPKNTDRWNYSEQMAGALFLEFGLYFTLGFEASALSIFEYSYDFLDEEIPLLTAGDARYYYGFNYNPVEDEFVVIRDEDKNSENGISMTLPDSVREMTYMTLNTGSRGYQALPMDRYHFTVSNPNFAFDSRTGKVSVTVPENIHFMECKLTITYLHGKLAFSSYDMSVTVPLVWTDLSDKELNEYFAASVRAGNDTDGYETVWSKRVLRGQGFDLPSDEEVKDMINYSSDSAKYSRASGYGSSQQLKGLTVITDTIYDYGINYQTYSLTVRGIQNADGSTRSETFTAKYGQTFDFSSLKNTGTSSGGEFTKFTNVTADGLDLSQPINGAMAEKLKSGVSAEANYIDDSAAAVFTFNGITHEDIIVRVRKGTTPGTSDVLAAIEEISDSENVGIVGITPALGNISQSTNYIVTCVTLSGERADVEFDMNAFDMFGSVDMSDETPDTRDRLVGSLIVNLPVVERIGYYFDGWFNTPDDGETAETQTVPDDGITLYAYWTPREYNLTFHINGGQGVSQTEKIVTYDAYYGELPEPTPKTGKRFVGWYTEVEGGTKITEDSVVKITEDTTLYAHYKDLVKINPEWIDFGAPEIFTYEKGVSRSAEYGFTDGLFFEDEADGEIQPFPTDGFEMTFVGTSGSNDSTEEPINAGTYKVRLKRPADKLYAAFEETYAGVLVIEKADRDVSSASIDTDNTVYGFRYLVVATTVDDIGSDAKVRFDMTIDGRDGITTSDGRCFFYDLNSSRKYTATLTHISITGDQNYNDTSCDVNISVSVETSDYPSSSWSSHAASELTTDIRTAEDMAALMNAINRGNDCTDMTFTLKNDIDMGAYEWDTAGKTFNGTFDGGKHKIYGLYTYNSGSDDVGLFGILGSNATVRNVMLAGGYIQGKNRVGGIAGYGRDGAIVDNCVNYATIYASGDGDSDAGGILGKVSEKQNEKGTQVRNCVNYGSVSGNGENTGGIMGHQMGKSTLVNCANYGDIRGADSCVGGIVGNNYNRESKVYNCVNAGYVTGSDSYRGAIAGRNDGDAGDVHQGYYLAGSAPNRTGAGIGNKAQDDDHDGLKCASFTSYTGKPSSVVEDNCTSGMTLLEVLNHWADRCRNEYHPDNWVLLYPGNEPVPENIPKF